MEATTEELAGGCGLEQAPSVLADLDRLVIGRLVGHGTTTCMTLPADG